MKTAQRGHRRLFAEEVPRNPRLDWVRTAGSTAVLQAERWADVLAEDLHKGDNPARTAYRAGLEDAIIIAVADHRRRTASRETKSHGGVSDESSVRIGRRLIVEYARPMATRRR